MLMVSSPFRKSFFDDGIDLAGIFKLAVVCVLTNVDEEVCPGLHEGNREKNGSRDRPGSAETTGAGPHPLICLRATVVGLSSDSGNSYSFAPLAITFAARLLS